MRQPVYPPLKPDAAFQPAKKAKKERLAKALQANLRRRKAAIKTTRPSA